MALLFKSSPPQNQHFEEIESDFYDRLKWLMFFRVLFTLLLLGSTIALQISESESILSYSLLILYGLIAGIFGLSIVYSALFNRIRRKLIFAYIQIASDTVVITFIIFVTGGFSSVFSFLYLVVIVYASMILFTKGSMLMAALCSIQYGILIDLEYYGILAPFMADGSFAASGYDWRHVLYKIVITMAACFAVAYLSSLLSEQDRKTKRELRSMEDHVKRVDKMAAVGEMAAGLAHEIKNPLASLTGSIQILKEDIPYNPDHDKLMQIVLREADRLSSLVTNFLMFAKPPIGSSEAIELSQALEETVKLFQNDTNCGGRLTIRKALMPDIWVAMDSAHLRQIFWNLLLNAAEAIKGDGNIDLRMVASKDHFVNIVFSDDGSGIAPDVIKSIFDPFFTTKPNGTGLGLSIIHSIVESYDGRLYAESIVNQGTTFTLKLKRIAPPATS